MLKTQLTAPQLYEKLKNIKLGASVCQYSLKKCEELVPIINEINELKEEKNAVILAHSYISPEIIYGVSDFVGDSYKLSKDALTTTAKTIVFVAVRFMGETAKILNPDKEVLVPATNDGCTLADAINAAHSAGAYAGKTRILPLFAISIQPPRSRLEMRCDSHLLPMFTKWPRTSLMTRFIFSAG